MAGGSSREKPSLNSGWIIKSFSLVAFVLVVMVVAVILITLVKSSKNGSSDSNSTSVDLLALPDGFMMACATSSYQIEGAWNVSGKGENIWDRLCHTRPELVVNEDSGDVACDSYHQYKRDVEITRETGFDVYRFSIAWSRVLPDGTNSSVNDDGIQYYHNLIDELLLYNITPLVTLYHWDLPQPLQDLGGWTNSSIADYFRDYADVMFREYGDKVKWWVSINDPRSVRFGYGTVVYAPALNDSGVSDYLATHNMLRGHAKVYKLYNETYKHSQKGNLGITIDSRYYTPYNESSLADQDAVTRALAFQTRIFSHPIFSKSGDYPSIVRERVDENSFAEGRNESRLPYFTDQEVDEIRGSSDFFGFDHYFVTPIGNGTAGVDPSFNRDSGAVYYSDYYDGESLRNVLKWIKEEYNNPPVFITENGCSSDLGLNDTDRIEKLYGFIQGVLEAIYEDGCNVIGYTVWSIVDNFEWTSGYSKKFGLWQVDFDDVNRTRTMKQSAYWFQTLLSTRRLPNTTDYL